jgi:hypothetical protein
VLKEQYSTLLGAVACYGGVMAADIVCHTQAEDNYAIVCNINHSFKIL